MAVEELCESINIISSLIVSLSALRIDSGGMHTRVIAKRSDRLETISRLKEKPIT